MCSSCGGAGAGRGVSHVESISTLLSEPAFQKKITPSNFLISPRAPGPDQRLGLWASQISNLRIIFFLRLRSIFLLPAHGWDKASLYFYNLYGNSKPHWVRHRTPRSSEYKKNRKRVLHVLCESTLFLFLFKTSTYRHAG